jgi:hypothetical protein
MEALGKGNSDCIRLVVIYRPPPGGKSGQPTSVFLEEFSQYMDSHATTTGRLVVTGDFNFHYSDLCNSETVKLRNCFNSLNLTQHVQDITHTKGHLLDLVLTRATEDIIHNLQVHAPILSDHAAIVFKLPVQAPPATRKLISYRRVKDIDVEAFKKDIMKSNLITHPADNIEDLVTQYNTDLMTTLNIHAPLMTKTVSLRARPPWYTDTIRAAKQSRRKAERRWRSTKLVIHLDLYKEESNKVNRLCSVAKKEYLSVKIEESTSDQKQLFHITNQLLHKKKCSKLPTFADEKDMADTFADYFEEKIQNIRKQFGPSSPDNQGPFQHDSIASTSMSLLSPTNEDELRKVIMDGNSKSCPLDPIPTSLLKTSLDCLLPSLTSIVNASLQSCNFPSQLKSAMVTPLLKKPSLDQENLKNYRPVSNLSYVSKLIEKVAVKRLNAHMTSNCLHEPLQSAYRQNHSTETALVKVYNDLLRSVDDKKCVMIVLLDLSAAFDTVDHAILFKRMENMFGISGDALKWLTSYLSNRTQTVYVSGIPSKVHPLGSGIPQGSVAGPFTFPQYNSSIGRIARKHGISFHLYADDSQLYIAFDICDGPIMQAKMEACISEVREWMSANFLKLNDTKTEFLLIGSRHILKQLGDLCPAITIGESTIPVVHSARNIGVMMDSTLSMAEHINGVLRSCYVSLHHISQIRQFLTKDAATKLVHNLVISKLDNLNALYFGIPDYLINKLQMIQNNCARLITFTKKYDHITPVLADLHWLPVCKRIIYTKSFS